MKKLAAILGFFLLSLAGSAWAQATYNPPTVYSCNATTGICVTAGSVNNGGHQVAVAAVGVGTLTVTTSKADCSAPVFANCNFVYVNSSGTVAVTTNLVTATAAGDTIIAYIETNGTTVATITYGWQIGTPYSNLTSIVSGGSVPFGFSCGSTSTCAATVVSQYKIASGTVALASASPSTVTVTALPFTTTNFTCTASPTGNTAAIAAAGVAITYSTNTVTFTGPNTVTTVINYICLGV